MGKIASRVRQRVVARMSESKQTTALVAGFLVLFLGACVYFGKYAPKLDEAPKVRASTSPIRVTGTRELLPPPKKVTVEKIWLDDPAKVPKRRTDIVTRQ